MFINQIRGLLSTITYKPDTAFRMAFSQDNAYVFQLTSTLLNADGADSIELLFCGRAIADNAIGKLSKDEIVMIIRQLVVDFEVHEVDEWFKVDGSRVAAVHAIAQV